MLLDVECDRGGHGLLGGCNGAQNHVLGFTVGQAMEVEVEAGEPHEQEGQPDDGQEEPDPAPESEDLGLKFHMVQAEDLGGNDGTRPTTNPTDGSRAWNTEVLEQVRVALLTDEVAHSVDIGASQGGSRHGSWSSRLADEASMADADSFCDFACVAAACVRVQNVLVRS